jgi:hypothetical protein
MAKLPSRPQWYRDMIAALRADRSAGHVPPGEFLELAADEIEGHPDYVRGALKADAAKYDRAVDSEQRAQFDDEISTATMLGYIKQSLFPDDVLKKLGLDVKLELGFGRSVQTVDATHEDRMKAIKELEDKVERWEKSTDRQIAAIRALDDLAGSRTLAEIIEEPPALGETSQ